MQPEDASTPLRQLYFVVQTMIIDPQNAHLTGALFRAQTVQIEKHAKSQNYLQLIQSVRELTDRENYFDALKVLRKSFDVEDELIHRSENSLSAVTRAA